MAGYDRFLSWSDTSAILKKPMREPLPLSDRLK